CTSVPCVPYLFQFSWGAGLRLDLGQHVRLAEDEELLAVHLDLGSAVLAVEDLVAFGDVERSALAGVLVDLAVADRENLALLGLFFRGVGQDDATGGRLLLLDRPHDQPIAKGLELHVMQPPIEGNEPVFSLWHSSHESAKWQYSLFGRRFKVFLGTRWTRVPNGGALGPGESGTTPLMLDPDAPDSLKEIRHHRTTRRKRVGAEFPRYCCCCCCGARQSLLPGGPSGRVQ